jgi:membrane-bound ClpP family serine protease
MAEWTIVVALVLIGLLLVIVEVIFIPGTTFVGVAGFASLVIGIILSFKYFGAETGWTTLGGSTAATGLLFYIAFKTNVWKRFALRDSISSKMNELEVLKFTIGLEGVATSALRPGGKGEFGPDTVEVRTGGEYVEAGSRIRIVRIIHNQIIVEIIN